MQGRAANTSIRAAKSEMADFELDKMVRLPNTRVGGCVCVCVCVCVCACVFVGFLTIQAH